MPLNIAILKEAKVPVDNRVPLTPGQCRRVQQLFPDVKIFCQKSTVRCYADHEYDSAGIALTDHVDHCDVLLGVKEVPVENLIPEKTYFIFSHTIKKQAYNRSLLREVLKDKIRLIDYECLTNELGQRIIAFGRWAGIVGSYNGLWTYGEKYHLYHIRRAFECQDLADLRKEFKKINLPPVKIVLTGGGRVAKGSMEVLDEAGVRKVHWQSFLNDSFDRAVYTQIDADVYTRRIDGKPFTFEEFFAHPHQFENNFQQFTHTADVLIAAAFWDPRAPKLFTLEDMANPNFTIRVIADITCDINGSVPSTIRPCTIHEPVYDFNRQTGLEEKPFSLPEHVSVMAIDNLPNELARDASNEFGDQMLTNVLPQLLSGDQRQIIRNATIAEKGSLTRRFQYLQDFVEGR